MLNRAVRFVLILLYGPGRIIAAGVRNTLRWWWSVRPPPWADIGEIDPLSEIAGNHKITFVSRHSIAECGLTCPECDFLVAGRGIFRGVARTRRGEGILCVGCGQFLLASPDTEHGDDLLPNSDDIHRKPLFVRRSIEQCMREQYGDDIVLHKGALSADADKTVRRDLPEPVMNPPLDT